MSDGFVLVGLPGSGKTAVGRCLAERLGRPFIDLDEEIERAAGRSPAQIINEEGEPAFRALERRAVKDACAVAGAVIATGGGAPLDPLNRWAFMEHGLRVRLDVPLEKLAERLSGDTVTRPLLGDDPLAGLSRTADERSPIYRAVDAAADADASADTVAAGILAAAGQLRPTDWRVLYDAPYGRHHQVGPPKGRIVMGRGLSAGALADVLSVFEGRPSCVVADRRALEALPLLAAALPYDRRLGLEGGESIKSFAQLESVLTWLGEEGAERADPLLGEHWIDDWHPFEVGRKRSGTKSPPSARLRYRSCLSATRAPLFHSLPPLPDPRAMQRCSMSSGLPIHPVQRSAAPMCNYCELSSSLWGSPSSTLRIPLHAKRRRRS
jgi:shikimate kinase